MFHKAINLVFKNDTTIELSFQDGKVFSYDVSALFDKFPQMKALNDRDLFLTGRLMGSYGIIWTDDIDLSTETVYENGTLVRVKTITLRDAIGSQIAEARSECGYTQNDLAKATGIDQADISRIERGTANPSISTLERIANALNRKIKIEFTSN